MYNDNKKVKNDALHQNWALKVAGATATATPTIL